MSATNDFRLSVNVTIANEQWSSGGLSIREETIIAPVDFKGAAEILEAFHTIVEKYKLKGT